MRQVAIVAMVLALAAPAGGGELFFANGSRLEGELANEVLLVSTGADLIEVQPEEVAELTREAIRLKDGRVIRGTLVGGHVKVRTALGEIAVKADELTAFRAAPPAAAAPAPAAEPAPREAAPAATAAPQSPVTTAAVPSPSATKPRPIGARLFEVIAGESALYRDAVEAAARVGRVLRGELVTYVDSIDRRLRILNTVIFDGGYWIKVRAADGTVGWLPADTLREIQ
ncbi:MAG: SH3 domain-containing protein [Candidatus Rokubacteria bacterium]|nr:SH3 domain-containing protein [Candidatus Rokubacteria bacterium]